MPFSCPILLLRATHRQHSDAFHFWKHGLFLLHAIRISSLSPTDNQGATFPSTPRGHSVLGKKISSRHPPPHTHTSDYLSYLSYMLARINILSVFIKAKGDLARRYPLLNSKCWLVIKSYSYSHQLSIPHPPQPHRWAGGGSSSISSGVWWEWTQTTRDHDQWWQAVSYSVT